MIDTAHPYARLCGVSKRYAGTLALDGVDLALQPGQVLALLGPNGAGKSTAIGLLLGLLRPDTGHVELMGGEPQRLASRRRVGLMLQSAGLSDTLRVGELLELTRSYYLEPRSVADCAALAGLDGLLGRRYGALSGGQQRRVQFALALCGRPGLLVLDEPTTGLDIEARLALWKAIREQVAAGCAVLLTTHYLEEAEALADRVAVLRGGRIVADGSVEEIRAHVARRRVRCRSRLAPDAVAAWPDVVSAVESGGRLEVVVPTAENLVRRLLDEDPALSELEIERAGLAEAFVELTREAA